MLCGYNNNHPSPLIVRTNKLNEVYLSQNYENLMFTRLKTRLCIRYGTLHSMFYSLLWYHAQAELLYLRRILQHVKVPVIKFQVAFILNL